MLLSLALVACQSVPKEVKQVDSRNAAVVRLESNCPVVKQELPPAEPAVVQVIIPLAIALAPVLAEVVVDGTSALLEKQRANRNFTTIASGSGTLLGDPSKGLELKSKCLVVFRGVLGPWDEARPHGKENQNGELTKTAMGNLGLAGFPDFYYEAWLTSEPTQSSTKDSHASTPSQDRKTRGSAQPSGKDSGASVRAQDSKTSESAQSSAKDSKPINITVTPKLIHFADTGAKSEGSGKKSIGLLLVLSKKVISDKSDQDFSAANATLPVLFKDITIGTELVDKATTVNGIFQDQVGSFGLDASASGPLNLYVVLNETEEPHLFEDIIIKSLSTKSADLKKSLTGIITDAIKSASEKEPDKK